MHFELVVLEYDLVELRWDKHLGKLGSATYHALADCLEAVPGVNRVEVLRYSAHITIATHVETLSSILEALQEHLLEDEQLSAVLNRFGVTNYSVTIDPGVVTRRVL